MAQARFSPKDYKSGTPGPKAIKNYKPGDVIISDKHFVHVVSHQYKREYCDNCCEPL
jgi:RNase P subunit RPR2